jgi:hypothetical protein
MRLGLRKCGVSFSKCSGDARSRFEKHMQNDIAKLRKFRNRAHVQPVAALAFASYFQKPNAIQSGVKKAFFKKREF